MRDWLTHLPWVTRQSWPKSGLDYWSAGRQVRPMSKICLHSTETTVFPGYANGAAAPHFTVSMKTGTTRQHIPLSRGARALMIGGSRLQNTGGVVQIEIIGAVTPGYPSKHGHYDLPNDFADDPDAQRYLARLVAAIAVEARIPLQESVDWITYPASSGQTRVRLSDSAFLNYTGVLGHQHVPSNGHGDPGALPMSSIVLPLARRIAAGGSTPTPPKPPVKPTPAPAPKPATPGRSGSVFFEGADGKDVHAWQADLHMLYGGLSGAGRFGPKTTTLTKTHQRVLGVTPDGRVGPATLTAHKEYIMSLEKKIDALAAVVDRIAKDGRLGTVHQDLADRIGKVHQDLAAGVDETNVVGPPPPIMVPLSAKGRETLGTELTSLTLSKAVELLLRHAYQTGNLLPVVQADVKGIASGVQTSAGPDAAKIEQVIKKAADAALSRYQATFTRIDPIDPIDPIES